MSMFLNTRGVRVFVIFAVFVTILCAAIGMRRYEVGPYETIVTQIQKSNENIRVLERRFNCVIEPGPPLRVAFRQPGGILDNWTAVVYDPTGLVLKAQEFKADWSNWADSTLDPGLREVKSLFGGDLRSVKPLGGSWYFCSFT